MAKRKMKTYHKKRKEIIEEIGKTVRREARTRRKIEDIDHKCWRMWGKKGKAGFKGMEMDKFYKCNIRKRPHHKKLLGLVRKELSLTRQLDELDTLGRRKKHRLI